MTRRKQKLFALNNFCEPCNHPNLYAPAECASLLQLISTNQGNALPFSLGVLLWHQSAVERWRSRDEFTTLASGPWANGEYKDCTPPNLEELKVLMTCDGFFGVEGKVFKVRFFGLTRFEDKPESFQSNGQCRKNDDGDPAVTCETRK